MLRVAKELGYSGRNGYDHDCIHNPVEVLDRLYGLVEE